MLEHGNLSNLTNKCVICLLKALATSEYQSTNCLMRIHLKIIKKKVLITVIEPTCLPRLNL